MSLIPMIRFPMGEIWGDAKEQPLAHELTQLDWGSHQVPNRMCLKSIVYFTIPVNIN